MSNVVDLRKPDWADWFLVFNGGQTLVGKLGAGAHGGGALSPCYQLNTSVKTDAQGRGVGIVRHMALLDYIDVPSVLLSTMPPHCPIADLSPGVQRELANGVAMAEEMRTKIRAAESGLVVP